MFKVNLCISGLISQFCQSRIWLEIWFCVQLFECDWLCMSFVDIH